MMDWQLILILAAVTGLGAFIVWDVIAPFVRRNHTETLYRLSCPDGGEHSEDCWVPLIGGDDE